MGKTGTKRPFPWGLLFTMLFILTLLSIASSAGYLYYTCTSSIRTTVESTRKHSTELIQALAGVAELSYVKNSYERLNLLLKEKMSGKNGPIAFFVLADGSIKAHSGSEGALPVGGNIAADEFTYNPEQIFYPMSAEANGVHFLEYNIVARTVPFDRYRRDLIKRFLYPNIGSTGWLATASVYHDKKPIGTINFIMPKESIYSIIADVESTAPKLLVLLFAGSVLMSLLISLLAYFSLGRVQLPIPTAAPVEGSPVRSAMGPVSNISSTAIRDAIPIIK